MIVRKREGGEKNSNLNQINQMPKKPVVWFDEGALCGRNYVHANGTSSRDEDVLVVSWDLLIAAVSPIISF